MTAPTLWTAEGIKALGPTIEPRTAFKLLGIGEVTGYAALRAGTFPVRALRVGRRYRIPTAELARALGLEDDLAAKGEVA